MRVFCNSRGPYDVGPGVLMQPGANVLEGARLERYREFRAKGLLDNLVSSGFLVEESEPVAVTPAAPAPLSPDTSKARRRGR